MDPWYDINSWSRQRREEMLQEAQTRHLVERTRVGRKQHSGGGSVSLTWESVLSLLRSAQTSE
jgi:hypothetical protein